MGIAATSFWFLCHFVAIYMIAAQFKNLKIVHEWSQIEFNYPNESARQKDIESGKFNEGQVWPTDVQTYYQPNFNLIFVATPRYIKGVPVTFGVVTNQKRKGNPIIEPYPSWDWHTEPEKCKKFRIVSSYRVFIDKYNRLWIVDNGKIITTQVCPPAILIFNLITHKLIHSYEVPQQQHKNTSMYSTIVVDVEDYQNSFAYVADVDGKSLLVYDYKRNKSWRIDDQTFHSQPAFNRYLVSGTTFKVKDGVLGLALSPPRKDRILYYHAMSSEKENWVYTRFLKNESWFKIPFGSSELFNTYPKGRGDQSAAQAMDKGGNLYFGLIGNTSIVLWNTKYPNDNDYERTNFGILEVNNKTLQFPSGVKVTENSYGDEELWILSNVYQKVATKQLSNKQINFRILYGKIREMRMTRELQSIYYYP